MIIRLVKIFLAHWDFRYGRGVGKFVTLGANYKMNLFNRVFQCPSDKARFRSQAGPLAQSSNKVKFGVSNWPINPNQFRNPQIFRYGVGQSESTAKSTISKYILDSIQDFFNNFRIKWKLIWVVNSTFSYKKWE